MVAGKDEIDRLLEKVRDLEDGLKALDPGIPLPGRVLPIKEGSLAAFCREKRGTLKLSQLARWKWRTKLLRP